MGLADALDNLGRTHTGDAGRAFGSFQAELNNSQWRQQQWLHEQQRQQRANFFGQIPSAGQAASAALLGVAPIKHWWHILEVTPKATVAEIKAAYRRLARRCHPDAGGTTEQMVELNKAYKEASNARSA